MLAIEALVLQTATRNTRGQWTFEGKTAAEWEAWAMGLKDIPGRHDDANEAFVICGRLVGLDTRDEETA